MQQTLLFTSICDASICQDWRSNTPDMKNNNNNNNSNRDVSPTEDDSCMLCMDWRRLHVLSSPFISSSTSASSSVFLIFLIYECFLICVAVCRELEC